MLRTLGCVYAVLALTGALLQRNPPSYVAGRATPTIKASPARPTAPPGWSTAMRPAVPNPFGKKAAVSSEATPASAASSPSVISEVLSPRFFVMWLMIICSAVAGLNTAGTYKTFGATQPALNSDAYLSLVGSLSAILGNAAGRFFWGPLTDG